MRKNLQLMMMTLLLSMLNVMLVNAETGSGISNNTKQRAVQYVNGTPVEVVTFDNDGYKTYVTENAIDWKETMSLNSVSGYMVTEFTQKSVQLTEFDTQITQKQTPVIIKGKKGKNYLVISDKSGDDLSSKNKLKKGSERKESEANSMYVLQKTPEWKAEKSFEQYKFYPLNPKRWNDIKDNQAYLVLESGPGAGESGPGPVITNGVSMKVVYGNDGEAGISEDGGFVDGINSVEQNVSFNGEFYSVSGVRVAHPTKGIYIVNGKKVLVK